MQGAVEGTTVVMGLPSWQVLAIVFSVVGIVLAGMTLALAGIMRAIGEHQRSINATIERGTEEHRVWQQEMKDINERVTDVVIDKEVERRLRERHGGPRH